MTQNLLPSIFSEQWNECDPTGDVIGLAVSGGVDSMTLAHLVQHVFPWSQRKYQAFHVNHNLRATAVREASIVQNWLMQWGMPCEILTWEHEGPSSGVQEKARDARYELLTAACLRFGITSLLMAHQADDQLETFFMRLGRGSGIKGLQGMSRQREIKKGLTLCRPMLTLSRTQIMSHATAHNVPFLEDPSNKNAAFKRVALRQKLGPFLQNENQDLYQQSLRRIRLANEALEFMVRTRLAAFGQLHPEGYATLSLAAFENVPLELVYRQVETLLMCVSGKKYPPRFASLTGICHELEEGKSLRGRTLAGCYLISKKGTLHVYREIKAIEKPRKVNEKGNFYWDQRFFIDNIKEVDITTDTEVGALGGKGLSVLRKQGHSLHDLPAMVAQSLPAFWVKGILHSVPLLVYMPHESVARVRFLPLYPFGKL